MLAPSCVKFVKLARTMAPLQDASFAVLARMRQLHGCPCFLVSYMPLESLFLASGAPEGKQGKALRLRTR